jgi:hypothetical protein
MPLGLELKAFTAYTPDNGYRPNALSSRLTELYDSNAPRVGRDFPAVARRYRSSDEAQASVEQAQESMVRREGAFGAYAVTWDDRVIGVATYEQMELVRLRRHFARWFPKNVLAGGPMLAVWLGARESMRRGMPQDMLSLILRLGARQLARTANVHGHPWTFVRPGHLPVIHALTDVNNRFGGFQANEGPRDYGGIDGVTSPRFLYIARRSIADLKTTT